MTERPSPADPHLAPGDAGACAVVAGSQAIGARLLLRGAELKVVAASANADGFLGRPLSMILGRSAADILRPALAARLPQALSALETEPVVPLGWLPLGNRGSWLTAQLQVSAGQLCMELEPGGGAEVAELGESRGGDPGERAALRWLRGYQQAIARAETLTQVCAAACQKLQVLTGYEQLVILQGAADAGGGLSAAVPVPPDDGSAFWARLALHCPLIAAERAALLQPGGQVYAVADVESAGVPLVWAEPHAATAQLPPGFRSVLDVPAEFVRHGLLGTVRAALLLTLSDGVRPWGCVLGGHSRPRWPSPQVRELCALAGMQLLARLVQLRPSAPAERRSSGEPNNPSLPPAAGAPGTGLASAAAPADPAGSAGAAVIAVPPPLASPAPSLSILAGGFAHDLNNLLTAVLGSVSQMRAAIESPQTVETHLEQIETAVLCAGDLCQQVLVYAGRGALTFARINLSQLVAETLPLLQLSISGRAHLKLQLLDDLPQVLADTTQLRQVLLNLVTNSAEAISAARSGQGEICIATKLVQLDADTLRAAYAAADASPGVHVALKVCDNGVGMAKAVLDRAFEPFFTTKSSVSQAGRGLGLSIVLGVVKGHRGVLCVRSNVGQGTEFELLFPSIRAASPEKVRAQPEGHSLPRLSAVTHTILVVDDEPTVREFIARVLRTAGYKVLPTGSAEEAVALAAAPATPISLALIDWALHRQEGESLARRLHGLRSALPLVILSGYGPSEYADRLHGLPIAGSLQKPFRLDALLRLVQRIIARSAP